MLGGEIKTRYGQTHLKTPQAEVKVQAGNMAVSCDKKVSFPPETVTGPRNAVEETARSATQPLLACNKAGVLSSRSWSDEPLPLTTRSCRVTCA